MSNANNDMQNMEARAKEFAQKVETLRQEIGKSVVGQQEAVDGLLMSIFCDSHSLLVGVPGLAKTLLVQTLSSVLELDFQRIQFTPDLMPSDITGTEVIQEDKVTGAREFKFLNGPVFANVVLADEINRTPPKTQAAMLEAMQERQVTVGMKMHQLPDPFFVLATQNPIEQEGTYTLPEAQQDRFMFKVFVDYPSYDEEYMVADSTTRVESTSVNEVLDSNDIKLTQDLVRRVPVPPHVIHYALRLVRATRIEEQDGVPDSIKDLLSWGAGPRAVQFLLLGAKAKAVMGGRTSATISDLKEIAHPVLRHRIITTFNAESSGVTTDDVVDKLIEEISERDEGDKIPPSLEGAFNAA